jgi:hypothetical protein
MPPRLPSLRLPGTTAGNSGSVSVGPWWICLQNDRLARELAETEEINDFAPGLQRQGAKIGLAAR